MKIQRVMSCFRWVLGGVFRHLKEGTIRQRTGSGEKVNRRYIEEGMAFYYKWRELKVQRPWERRTLAVLKEKHRGRWGWRGGGWGPRKSIWLDQRAWLWTRWGAHWGILCRLWLLHEEETSGGKMGNGTSAWEAALGICASGWISRGSCKVCGWSCFVWRYKNTSPVPFW